jgi:replicative DNA helicase
MSEETEYTIKTSMAKVVDHIERMFEKEGEIYGLSTGFTDIDELTGGLSPGNLVVVAGRPSMGTTAFALNIAENVALKNDKPVVYFSMEMNYDDLMMRLMASLGRINTNRIRSGRLTDDDWPRLTSAINLLAGTQLIIVNSPMLNAIEISEKAKQLAQEEGQLGLIVIDYVQLMGKTREDDDKKLQIEDITRRLKALAKNLNVPVVLLSTLSRNLEARPNKRPILSDFFEYEALEQDADVIMFVYRDEVYWMDDSPDKGIAEIIVAKHRCGPLGTVRLGFIGQYKRFENFCWDPKKQTEEYQEPE